MKTHKNYTDRIINNRKNQSNNECKPWCYIASFVIGIIVAYNDQGHYSLADIKLKILLASVRASIVFAAIQYHANIIMSARHRTCAKSQNFKPWNNAIGPASWRFRRRGIVQGRGKIRRDNPCKGIERTATKRSTCKFLSFRSEFGYCTQGRKAPFQRLVAYQWQFLIPIYFHPQNLEEEDDDFILARIMSVLYIIEWCKGGRKIP